MRKWTKYLYLSCMVLLASVLLSRSKITAANEPGYLTVTFLYVGQGDCILLQSEGESMLVDGGRAEYGSNVVEYLKSIGITELSYALITHDDPDHIGGYNSILKSIQVRKILHTGLRYTDNTNSKNANELIRKKQILTSVPTAGSTMKLGSATIEFLAPNGKDYKAYNDNSIVIRVVNGENSFLLTGDAEKVSEKEMLEKGYNLKSDVLKVGHHSALTSTSQEFLNAVNPSMSVISCDEAGASGFPRLATIAKLKKTNIYRTDIAGHIVMVSDGEKIITDADPYFYANSGFNSSTGKITRTMVAESALLKDPVVSSEYDEIELHRISADENYDLILTDPVTLSFEADPGVTKLDSIEYALVSAGETPSLSDMDWKELKHGSVTVKKDFQGCVYVKFSNKLGNILIRKTDSFILDCHVPAKCKVKSNLKNLSLLDIHDPNSYRRYTAYNESPILDFSCNYGISGKGSVEYMLVEKGASFHVDDIWEQGATARIERNFIGRVYVRFTDGAGNEAIYKTQGFTYIKGSPTNIVMASNVSGVKLLRQQQSAKKLSTKQTVKLAFTADFGHGGRKAIRYQFVKRGKKYSAKAKWITGSNITLGKGFAGTVYIKFVDRSNRTTLRKTNFIHVV
ncbi:ComEC/Rec2 family competence protein [[Clostridium] polysaccharolyticum]|uniref:Metal-dependent hydrolase, beta-lactamase superfamily II n=1 Tax=[Clostridium] polysaccharolyticum TaxID=29364 RepID=A0A1H9ZEV2_9FIRM|nr:MBL fold metallo-hydrolase [[Clostridium] polysaccharolyticum]SES80118.1 Metal-dependent hydrolase, beta-lactamase superfamily II [[Clostridium] polysaccharolyticum]